MRALALMCLVLFASAAGLPAHACGFGETPGDCGDTPESGAQDMLKRVVVAVRADEPNALKAFTRGEQGFRTQDTYVFCVGPDGVMSAHPNPALRGTDVRDLHDSTGNHFIARMLQTAQAGKVSSIRYLFPLPGGTREYPKTTFYTRAGDQVCGVGVYDDDGKDHSAPVPPAARLADLRQRLTNRMPPALGDDWAAFQKAMDEDNAAKAAAFASVRSQVQAADAAFDVQR